MWHREEAAAPRCLQRRLASRCAGLGSTIPASLNGLSVAAHPITSMSNERANLIPKRVLTVLAVTITAVLVPSLALAQATRPTTEPVAAADDPLVGLNLPENAPLKVLIDY